MSKGRGSAMVTSKTLLMCMCMVVLLVSCEMAHAAIYTVGPGGRWTFNVVGWPQGKRLRAGDILVFNYSPAYHNVVAVNKGGYDSCATPRGARVYTSGRDQIKLVKGPNYFICNFPGHCESNMKIAVTAI